MLINSWKRCTGDRSRTIAIFDSVSQYQKLFYKSSINCTATISVVQTLIQIHIYTCSSYNISHSFTLASYSAGVLYTMFARGMWTYLSHSTSFNTIFCYFSYCKFHLPIHIF